MAKEKKKKKDKAKTVTVDKHEYPEGYVPRLRGLYEKDVTAALQDKFKFGNKMELPQLKKIILNVGLGEAVQNPKLIDSAVDDIRTITGQQPVVRRARKSIAGFKLREGLPIGVKVTLRRNKMWEFADRLFSLALPRVRDFKGVNPKGFDGSGNFTMGVKEQIIFPEIDYDKVDAVRGMNITFVTSAETNEEGRELLALLGMPFRRNRNQQV
jgi:large subunit ribosomal protein L5